MKDIAPPVAVSNSTLWLRCQASHQEQGHRWAAALRGWCASSRLKHCRGGLALQDRHAALLSPGPKGRSAGLGTRRLLLRPQTPVQHQATLSWAMASNMGKKHPISSRLGVICAKLCLKLQRCKQFTNCRWCYCELQIYNLKKLVFNITADDYMYIESELPARILQIFVQTNQQDSDSNGTVESKNKLNFLDWGFTLKINRTAAQLLRSQGWFQKLRIATVIQPVRFDQEMSFHRRFQKYLKISKNCILLGRVGQGLPFFKQRKRGRCKS